MADDPNLEVTNTRNSITAGVTDVLPNLDAIQRNFVELDRVINQLNSEISAVSGGNVTIPATRVTVDNTNLTRLLDGLNANGTLQVLLNTLDARGTATRTSVTRTNFDEALDGFTGADLQALMDYIDGNLALRQVIVPGITNFSVGFNMVQATGFNLFDNLAGAQRTFNADITETGQFTSFALIANAQTIATFSTLTGTSRAILIPDTPAGRTAWTQAVAAATTDANNRSVVNFNLRGIRPAGNIESNTQTIRIGQAAQRETFYYVLSTAENGVTLATSSYAAFVTGNNPATFDFMVSPPTNNTSPLYLHVMIPARFETVRFLQITVLGNLPADAYFQNFNSPGSRTIATELYKVYSFGPVVPEYRATFRLTVQDVTP